MNPHLQQQQEAFKKTLKRQPEIVRHIAAERRPESTSSPSLSISSISGPRPINSIVHAVISFLKVCVAVATVLMIRELRDRQPYKRNDRISFDGTLLCYKPVFTIKSKEDILETLKQQQDMAGIDLAELKEAYPKIEETVAELAREGKIFLIRPREDGPKVLFSNDMISVRSVDADFKTLWSSIPVPSDDHELRGEIRRAGMKVSSQQGSDTTKGKRPEPKKKASSRRRFPVKITNDYLEGIDLSRDLDT